jgi:hypothetical protein
LKLFLIFAAGLTVLSGVFEILRAYFPDYYLLIYYVNRSIYILLLWFFIGKELNRMNEGLIAGGITILAHIGFYFLESKIPIPASFILASFSGAIYFAYQTHNENKWRARFILIAGIGMNTLGELANGMGFRDFWYHISDWTA